MTRENTALWAQLRDTHGKDLASSVPRATLIAAHPNLRALDAPALAEHLGISEPDARDAIVAYVADAIPRELLSAEAAREGASVDVLLTMAGRSAEPGWMGASARARREAAGWNDTDYGSSPLPIGYAYRMPNRVLYEAGAVAAYQSGTGAAPSPIGLDAPTGFDAQMATCLRGDVPSDPGDPSLPHPDWIRAFCFAMRPSGAGMVTNANGELTAHPGGVLLDGSEPALVLAESARGVREYDAEWPRPIAGEVFNVDAIRKAYSAFQWYGPLPGDVETPDGVKYWGDWPDGISRERYVFFYAIDGDGNWNRCLQVQGWDGTAWTLPSHWGELSRVWQWRPTDGANPHNVGEWKTFFSFDNWLNENKTAIAVAAFWISSIVVTVSTLGAGAATLAAAATVSALLIAAQKLMAALVANDPAKTVAACLEIGKAMNNAAGGDLGAAIKRDHPELAAFTTNVCAPFQKIYEAAGGALSDVRALWAKAQGLKSDLPIMGQVAWAAAVGAIGGVGGTNGPAAWLQMSRLPTNGEIANELWENAPGWAKDVVALGLSLSALELAQASGRGSAYHSGSILSAPKLSGAGGGVLQISAPNAQAIRTLWQVPPPPVAPPIPVFVPTDANGAPQASSAAAPVIAAAGIGLAWFLGFFK